MTIGSLERRLRKIEQAEGIYGDVEDMNDAQLRRVIRSGYRQFATEHGNLAQAARHFRGTGNPDDMALAILIEEDTGGPNAIRH